jgi:hypothetical protein
MRGTGVWFLEGAGDLLDLPDVPETMEFGTAWQKKVFINCVRKPAF